MSRTAIRLSSALAGGLVLCLAGLGPVPLAHAADAAAAAPLAQAAAQGRQIFDHDKFGGIRTCGACHINGGATMGNIPGSMGTKIPSLVGAAAQFPKYNPRANRVITLQQQLDRCIKGGLKGTPPAADSSEMTALITYLTKLSRGSVMGQQFK